MQHLKRKPHRREPVGPTNNLVKYGYSELQWGGPWPANLDRKMTFYFSEVGVGLPEASQWLCPPLRQLSLRPSNFRSRNARTA
jgi:hypothetical protein